MSSIEHRVFAIVEHELGLEPGRVTAQLRLADHGDSLDWFALMVALEDAFGIEIGEGRDRAAATVGDLLSEIRAHVPA